MTNDPLQAWKKIDFFVPSEFDDPNHPGSGILMDIDYIYRMNNLRRVSKCRIKIHKDNGGGVDMEGTHGHSGNSQHLKKNGCKASDWHFEYDPDYPEASEHIMNNPRLQTQLVMSAGFGGIGIYYDWGIPVGFHTDSRPYGRYQVWTRENGKYIYLIK